LLEQVCDESSTEPDKESTVTLRNVLADLFIAGSETTSTVLTWATLFMAKHPDIQKKVQAELDQVCGSQNPTIEDRNKLPYTEATITEILRRANILPISLFHAVTEDTTVMGYILPKGLQYISYRSSSLK
jgi:cytochrome P450